MYGGVAHARDVLFRRRGLFSLPRKNRVFGRAFGSVSNRARLCAAQSVIRRRRTDYGAILVSVVCH